MEDLYLVHTMNEEYLAHHGILGQKWGVRRYQNPDGTLTEAGRKRLNSDISKANESDKKTTKIAKTAAKVGVAAGLARTAENVGFNNFYISLADAGRDLVTKSIQLPLLFGDRYLQEAKILGSIGSGLLASSELLDYLTPVVMLNSSYVAAGALAVKAGISIYKNVKMSQLRKAEEAAELAKKK